MMIIYINHLFIKNKKWVATEPSIQNAAASKSFTATTRNTNK